MSRHLDIATFDHWTSYSLIILAQLSRLRSPFSALRVSTISGANLANSLVVDPAMISDDHDAIGGAQSSSVNGVRLKRFAATFSVCIVKADLFHKGIVIMHVRALCAQTVDD